MPPMALYPARRVVITTRPGPSGSSGRIWSVEIAGPAGEVRVAGRHVPRLGQRAGNRGSAGTARVDPGNGGMASG
jgi:hypothetical protein